MGLLRRELSVVSGSERGCTKIAISRLFASIACALSGIGRRSSFPAFDLRGSVRGYETEAQKQRSRYRRLQLRNRSDSRVSIHGYLVAKERRCSPGHRICPRPADVHALHASCQAQQVLGPTRSGYRPTSSAKNLAKDSSSIGVHAIVPETERRKPKRHTASDSSFERKAKVDSAVQ